MRLFGGSSRSIDGLLPARLNIHTVPSAAVVINVEVKLTGNGMVFGQLTPLTDEVIDMMVLRAGMMHVRVATGAWRSWSRWQTSMRRLNLGLRTICGGVHGPHRGMHP